MWEKYREGLGICNKALRQLPRNPAARARDGHLQEPQAQAKARVMLDQIQARGLHPVLPTRHEHSLERGTALPTEPWQAWGVSEEETWP